MPQGHCGAFRKFPGFLGEFQGMNPASITGWAGMPSAAIVTQPPPIDL
jgi:hypothetical protein